MCLFQPLVGVASLAAAAAEPRDAPVVPGLLTFGPIPQAFYEVLNQQVGKQNVGSQVEPGLLLSCFVAPVALSAGMTASTQRSDLLKSLLFLS